MRNQLPLIPYNQASFSGCYLKFFKTILTNFLCEDNCVKLFIKKASITNMNRQSIYLHAYFILITIQNFLSLQTVRHNAKIHLFEFITIFKEIIGKSLS